MHETHGFAGTPTTLADFREQGLYEGDAIVRAMRGTRAGIGGMIAGAERYGRQLAQRRMPPRCRPAWWPKRPTR